MAEELAEPRLRLGRRVRGRVAEVHAGLGPVGNDVGGDAAPDRGDAHHLSVDEAVDLHVADRKIGDRGQRTDRGRGSRSRRATAGRCAPPPRAPSPGRRGSPGTRPGSRCRWAPSPARDRSCATGGTGRTRATARSPRWAAPPARRTGTPRRGRSPGWRSGERVRQLEHHRERPLHVRGTPPHDGGFLASAGHVPGDRHRIHVAGEDHERHARGDAPRARRTGPRRRRPASSYPVAGIELRDVGQDGILVPAHRGTVHEGERPLGEARPEIRVGHSDEGSTVPSKTWETGPLSRTSPSGARVTRNGLPRGSGRRPRPVPDRRAVP